MFGRSKEKPEYGILIDINSGNVGVAILALMKEKDESKLIFTHRLHMRIGASVISPEDRMRQMRETLFSASLILSRDGLQALALADPKARIEKLFLVSSSPWAHTLSREVLFENEKEFKVTEELLSDLSTSAINIDTGELHDPAVFKSEYEVIERATVNVRINGYIVAHPLELSGQHISLSEVTGFVLKDILDAVTEVRDKIFADTPIETHTSMFTSYCVFRDLFPETEDMTLVHVTGEATELALIERGLLEETHSVLYGYNTLIREIIEKTKETPEHIVSMLRSFAENRLHDESQSLIEAQASLFDQKFNELCALISSKRSIPKTVILLVEPGMLDFIKSRVISCLSTLPGQTFKLLELTPTLLPHMVESEEGDLFLSLQARFFHKLHTCGEKHLS